MRVDGRTWHDLRLFLEVARWKSFNKAGEAMGATHPTMARAVRRLELSFKTPLVTAWERGIELTDAGAALARRLETIDRSVVAALEAVIEY